MVSRRVSAYRALASDKRVAMLHELQRSSESLGIDELAASVGLHVNTAREHLERLIDSGFVESQPEQRTTRGRPRILYRAVERVAPATTDGWARDQLMRLLVNGYGRRLSSASGAAEDAGSVWGRSLTTNGPGKPGNRTHRAAGHPTASTVVASPEQGPTEPVEPVLIAPPDADEPAAEPTGSDSERSQLAALTVHFEDLGFEPEPDDEKLELRLHRCPFRDLARERPEVVCSIHLGLARGVLAQQGGPLTAEWLEPTADAEGCVLHLARS
jgi:predicted ArsR family transcriptional regulator